ncbi:MAG TPA: hypothetical protein VNB90_05880 [Cytophagaceae bacterium]|nr:hypothetical protein [Cytophagaceae bacterium]
MTTGNLTIKQAVQSFYDQNNFADDGGVSEKYAWIKFGAFSIPIPNVESRRNNVYLHDINHILTGNDTNWKGESAVSAWEIAAGGWKKFYIPWLLTLWAMGLGVFFYPKNTISWFKKGLSMRNALTCGLTKLTIQSLTVSDMQGRISNYPKSNKSVLAWILISASIFFIPFLLAMVLISTTIFLLIK